MNKYHKIYVNHLKELFDRHKAEYGDKNSELKLYPPMKNSESSEKSSDTKKP